MAEIVPQGQRLSEIARKFATAKRASAIAAIDWVFANVGRYVTAEDADDAPSMGAIRLLDWVNESDENRKYFYTQIWAKVIPSRSEISQMPHERDDGRVLELLARMEAEFYSPDPAVRPDEADAQDLPELPPC